MSDTEIRAGGAFVEIGGKNDALKQKLSLSLADFRAWGEKMRNAGLMMAAGVGAAIFVINKMVTASSNLEEITSKFDVVFKEGSNSAKAWAEQYSNSIGRSKRETMDFMAQWQGYFAAMGFSRGLSADLTKTLTSLVNDISSLNDTPMIDVMQNLRSAMSGETEAVRKYGVNLNEASVNQEMLRLRMRGTMATASQHEKALAFLSIIMRQTADAQGDAARTAGSWANMMRALGGAFDNVMTNMGEQIKEILRPYLKITIDITQAFAQWVKRHPELVDGIMKLMRAVGLTSLIFIGLGGAIVALLSPATYVFGAIAAMLEGLGLDTGIKQIFGAASGLEEIVKGFVTVAETFLRGLWEKVKSYGLDAWSYISNGAMDAFADVAKFMLNAMSQVNIIGKPMIPKYQLQTMTDSLDQSRFIGNMRADREREQRAKERAAIDVGGKRITEMVFQSRINPEFKSFLGNFKKPDVPSVPNFQKMLGRAMEEAKNLKPYVPVKKEVVSFQSGVDIGTQLGAAFGGGQDINTQQLTTQQGMLGMLQNIERNTREAMPRFA